MTREQQLLTCAEKNVERMLPRTSAAGVLQEDGFTDTRYTGFCLALFLTVYVHPASRFHENGTLFQAMDDCLVCLERDARESGLFDLSSCNFDSAPDTAFTVNALSDAYQLLMASGVREAESFGARLLAVLVRAAKGICGAGFHTPNHRWAIASALKQVAAFIRETDRETASALEGTADRYLAEGLDISGDGEFAERSAGTYNVVNDDQMIRLYQLTGDGAYIRAAKQNLAFMLHYFEPDGSIFTLNSTRQDYGKKVWPSGYWKMYLMVGYLTEDPDFAGYASWMWEASVSHGETPDGLAWLMLHPGLEQFGREPDLSCMLRYARVFPHSGVGRWRWDDMVVTALAGKPDFLYVTKGDMNLCLSLYANVCDKRNFVAQAIEPLSDHAFRLVSRFESWYYEPFAEKQETSDWWQMDHGKRPRQVRDCLEIAITADLRLQEGYLSLTVSAKGLSRVPLRLELGFTPGELRTESLRMRAAPGGEATVLSGSVQMTGKDHTLSVGPCFARHNVCSRMGGAFPRANDRFTVYLTDITPCERTLRISDAPCFPDTME